MVALSTELVVGGRRAVFPLPRKPRAEKKASREPGRKGNLAASIKGTSRVSGTLTAVVNLGKMREVVGQAEAVAAENERELQRLIKTEVLGPEAGSEYIQIVRFLTVLKGYAQAAKAEETRIEPLRAQVGEEVRLQWDELRLRFVKSINANKRLARKAKEHFDRLFEKSDRAGDLETLQAAALWVAEPVNAETLAELARQ
ncbi:MAG: hypothetical protein RIF41_26810 [Polyangiaceae bacterium]